MERDHVMENEGMVVQETTGSREHEVLRVAQELYTQSPDWVTFFRAVLGISGVVREAFPTVEELSRFEHTREYAEIQHMLAKLREKGDSETGREPTRVITVRLPQSRHESLRAEAHQRRTSMNKLCISKLLQVIDAELIPSEA